jgi:hypothetical protein
MTAIQEDQLVSVTVGALLSSACTSTLPMNSLLAQRGDWKELYVSLYIREVCVDCAMIVYSCSKVCW